MDVDKLNFYKGGLTRARIKCMKPVSKSEAQYWIGHAEYLKKIIKELEYEK